MNDLISRSAAKEELLSWAVCINKPNLLNKEDALHVLDTLPAVDAVEVVRCENCTHQQKDWHDDKRMKEGGFFIYSCKLNDDPFVTHVVNGNPGEFCCAGERRTDDA